MSLITFKNDDYGEIIVTMFCDIEAKDVYAGLIEKTNGNYRFLPEQVSFYCAAMILISDELSRLNDG